MESELKTLIHKRAAIKSKLTRFKTYFENNKTSENIPQIKLRLLAVENILKEFDEVQLEIELKDITGEQTTERDIFEDSYFAIINEANEFVKAYTDVSNNSNLISQVSTNNNSNTFLNNQIRLPIINLPTFEGSFDEWSAFKESFQALVDNNNALPEIQKFYYLKSCLKGEAINVIHSLEASAANYAVAWTLLTERFENTKLIVNKYVSSMFNLTQIQKENSQNLRSLIDNMNRNVRALQALGQPTEHWGTLLIYLISTKLPITTMQDWEKFCKPKELPTLSDMLSFLQNRCQILETIENQCKTQTMSYKQEKFDYKVKGNTRPNLSKPNLAHSTFTTTNSSGVECKMCNKDHKIFQCEAFLKLEVTDRINKVKFLGLCFNCLKSDKHRTIDCKSSNCKVCNKKHNTLLHIPTRAVANNSVTSLSPQLEMTSIDVKQPNIEFHQPNQTNQVTTLPTTMVNSSHSITSFNHVLLPTAIINVEDSQGNLYPCRALLDSASQCNFISEHMTQLLRLKKEKILSSIIGVSQTTTNTSKQVHTTIRSRFTPYSANLDFIVLPKITIDLPSTFIDPTYLKLPSNVQLADPTWHKGSKIDMLLGAEIFMSILEPDCEDNYHPNLKNTKFGVVVSGNCKNISRSHCSYSSNFVTCHSLDSQLQRFWSIDEIKQESPPTPNDIACEKHYIETTTRDSTGRYTVSMPLKHSIDTLGHSFDIANTRLLQMERRFENKPDLHKQYSSFMKEYQELDHMELQELNDTSAKSYFLPHHAVLKDTSTTTKLRVVFDGSAKPSRGLALNDIQLVGPCIQQDLFSIVSRFRTYNYAITADIEKMYRQILIEEKQRDLLKILWRDDPLKPKQVFKLKTVTYGTASAPYLATRTLHQLAYDDGHLFPSASEILMRDFYMDDLLSGANTEDEIKQLQKELVSLLSRGGFNLRKWMSNNSELISCIPEKDKGAKGELSSEYSTKTLGILWNARFDYFYFTLNNKANHHNITKRTVLSEIAQIFDPLGLLAPVVVKAKLFVQHLWKLQIGWDENLRKSEEEQWQKFKIELQHINFIHIPRRVLPADFSDTIEIHGFCDASESAYGACIYIRQIDVDENIHSSLLCSKSRVAPVKKVSLPRLELCAALLLSHLINKLLKSLNLPYKNCTLWSDSTIALAWINSSSSRWKTFVANRVSEIQDLTKECIWKHVRSQDNPADIVSRGTSPLQLKDSALWWNGPQWLSKPNSTWPNSQIEKELTDHHLTEERKVSAATVSNETFMNDLINKYSSVIKLERVVAYCLRFIHNSQSKHSHKRLFGPLSCYELHKSRTAIIKNIQEQEFSDDFKNLRKENCVKKKSKLKFLRPFLDDDELIRVGGRLQQSPLDYNQKHNIVLPNSKFAQLLVDHYHKIHLHAGPQLLLGIVRQKYWVINGRNLVKKICRQCITCFKVNPKSTQQLMGSLPKERVEPSRPFINTGVDYCGPVYIKTKSGRGGTKTKTYIVIFVCLAVKAVHIELVQDLTSETFIAALKRFMARRGKVSKIFSDNGTNFVGANKELRELKQLFQEESFVNKITAEMSSNHIEWKFTPPKAPHFGGLWEAAVKSTKYHLKRITMNTTLTYDELYTLLTQIEASLNSRPLIPLSDDPTDFSYLTPGHFLIGESFTTNLEPNLQCLKVNKLSRWQKVQQMFQFFWSKWSTEYLSYLQRRGKWTEERNNIKVDDLVILQDNGLPPLKWKMGRVAKVFPGKDQKVRVVDVKTNEGTFKRAVTSLCPFPTTNDEA